MIRPFWNLNVFFSRNDHTRSSLRLHVEGFSVIFQISLRSVDRLFDSARVFWYSSETESWQQSEKRKWSREKFYQFLWLAWYVLSRLASKVAVAVVRYVRDRWVSWLISKPYWNLPEHVILETENVNSETRENRDISQSSAYRLACPGVNDCVALRDCPQVLVEATTRCYNSDRSMFCGVNQNYEPYVCCPPPSYVADSSNNFNAQDKLAGPCGKSLIQGSFYKKLGAYPFVARVGFKSEYCRCQFQGLLRASKINHDSEAQRVRTRSWQYQLFSLFKPLTRAHLMSKNYDSLLRKPNDLMLHSHHFKRRTLLVHSA